MIANTTLTQDLVFTVREEIREIRATLCSQRREKRLDEGRGVVLTQRRDTWIFTEKGSYVKRSTNDYR